LGSRKKLSIRNARLSAYVKRVEKKREGEALRALLIIFNGGERAGEVRKSGGPVSVGDRWGDTKDIMDTNNNKKKKKKRKREKKKNTKGVGDGIKGGGQDSSECL